MSYNFTYLTGQLTIDNLDKNLKALYKQGKQVSEI